MQHFKIIGHGAYLKIEALYGGGGKDYIHPEGHVGSMGVVLHPSWAFSTKGSPLRGLSAECHVNPRGKYTLQIVGMIRYEAMAAGKQCPK